MGAIALAFLAAAGGYLLRDSQDLDPRAWSHCVDASSGYDVQYPAEWHTSTGGAACRFFDPEPFSVPANSDFGGTALEVLPQAESFDDSLAALIDTRFARTELREEATVGGHAAFRLELVATGRGLADRGTRTYGYLVRGDVGPAVLVQTTAAPGERIRHRDVVDHAARTLQVFPPQAESEDVAGLPAEVEEKRRAILEAAQSGDEEAVAALADEAGFEYTFGGPVEGGPAEYWRQIESERPLEQLATILQLPPTLSRGLYVWPFAYDKTEDELTDYERELLEPLGEGGAFADGYFGWRAGITPDGRWVFFVAGD